MRAQDLGDDLKYDSAVVDILVVESYKKAPSFLTWPHEPIRLKENFSDRDAIIAKLEADSNVPDDDRLTFEFAIRSTQQTNGSDIFRYNNDDTVRCQMFLDGMEIALATCGITEINRDFNRRPD